MPFCTGTCKLNVFLFSKSKGYLFKFRFYSTFTLVQIPSCYFSPFLSTLLASSLSYSYVFIIFQMNTLFYFVQFFSFNPLHRTHLNIFHIQLNHTSQNFQLDLFNCPYVQHIQQYLDTCIFTSLWSEYVGLWHLISFSIIKDAILLRVLLL